MPGISGLYPFFERKRKMSTNFVAEGRFQVKTVVSTVVSGDPVVFGSYLHGVAQGDYGTGGSATTAVIDMGPGIYDLPVKGHDGSIGSAVALYDAIFYDSGLPGLNKNSAGVFFGYALETVNSAATTTINVYMSNVQLPLGVITAALISNDIVSQKKFDRDYTLEEFESAPVASVSTGGAPSGTGGVTNIMQFEDNTFEYFMIGTQTLLVPTIAAAGLLASLDLTSNDGVEYSQGITARSRSAFVVGTSPAFVLKVGLTVADVSGSDICAVGFRKAAQAYQAAFADYTDKATLNKILGAINIETALNNDADVTTDTTNTWVDGATKVLEVYVSTAGVVTYKIDGVAPTVTAAFTFDTGDVVVPFFHLLHDASTPGAVHITSWECGLQSV
jgi:predicted RecA/RadA family phage recombinase